MAKINLVIDQGSTFTQVISLTGSDDIAVNTDVYTARGQIRKHYLSNTSVSFTTILANGDLTLSLTSIQTANIVAGRYVYDVELIDSSNNVTRLMEGIVTITPEVSK
jgi:tricorn protease-like protein